MKKYIIIGLGVIIILLLLFIVIHPQVGSYAKPLDSVTKEEQAEYVKECVHIIDLTFDGETHQYVYTGGNGDQLNIGGHWKGCKYCSH